MIAHNFTLSPSCTKKTGRTLLPFQKFLLLSVFLFLTSFATHAQFLKSGDIRVYANAMLSTQLSSAMASQYGITRSASNVLLHLVVRQGEPGKDHTLPAIISAVAIRKNGERSNINMQTTREGQEIYYLGELHISGNEAINFEIVAQVDKQKPMRLTFHQEFFNQ